MKVEITSEEKNPLLNRTEVTFQVVDKTTPSRAAVKGELAKALKAKENMIVIDIVDQKTGSNLTTGRAKVYSDEETKAKVDFAYRDKRVKEQKKEEPKEETKPAEAPNEGKKEEIPAAEEAPAEEKKEEAKAEEKPAE